MDEHDAGRVEEHGTGPRRWPGDETDDLARILGLEPRELAEAVGAGWRRLDQPVAHDFDADPSGGLEGAGVTPWHVSGEPAQLMMRVFEHGVLLAAPRGIWAGGTHGLELHEDGPPDYVAAGDLLERGPSVVARLLARRRRRFRWCRWCRQLRAPEDLLDQQTCHGCGTAWFGVVY